MATVAELSKGTFNLLDAVKGRSYPEREIEVYTDVATAKEIVELDKQASDLPAEKATEINKIDRKIKALKKTLDKSKLVFTLRGISVGASDGIRAKAEQEHEGDEPQINRAANFGYLAAHIVSVKNADGEVDARTFTVEDVEVLHDFLPESEFEKIFESMQELSFQAAYFDAAVSADFLSKS